MQRNDPELIEKSVYIQKRAVRRIGELIEDERKAGKLSKGARGSGSNQHRKVVRVDEKPTPTLADRGVNKNLADAARKAAAMPASKYEAETAKAIRIAIAASEGDKAVIREARAAQQKEKCQRREHRERELGAKQFALPDERFGVIVADPEWRFEPWSRLTGLDRSADNHYPTSCTEVIASRNVASIAADDAVLFLWATAPMLPHALVVMAAWGFNYVSQYVWGKDKIGPGYWNREKHELLLIGTCGNIPCPAPGTQWDSLITEPRGAHSAKPERFLEMIEVYFPHLPKIELNRRGPARPGWKAWGNEVITQQAAE
jgi:N6-adenosine-specific RNA methylase IME4